MTIIFFAGQAAKSLVSEGFELRNQGNYRGAIEKFDQVIAQDDAQAKPFLYRAQTFIQMRAYDAALKDFRKVLQLDPHNARACMAKGLRKLS